MHWTSSISMSVSPKNLKDPSNAFSGSWWVPKRRYLMGGAKSREERDGLTLIAATDILELKKSKKCFSGPFDPVGCLCTDFLLLSAP